MHVVTTSQLPITHWTNERSIIFENHLKLCANKRRMKSKEKSIKKGVLCLCLMTLVSSCTNTDMSERHLFVESLFTGAEQYEWLNRLATVFPNHRIRRGEYSFRFPIGDVLTLPNNYRYRDQYQSTSNYLEETDTAALLIVHKGAIRYESYWLTGAEDVHWMSFSVGKSFLSAMIGIALHEGHIGSIEEAITTYVPELKGSAYDGVRIKDILQMSSGAGWNEDYSDPDSDIVRFAGAWANGDSLDDFTASLVREKEPGTFNYYNSMDTQALGMMMVRATGMTLSKYAEQKLWQPLGMEQDAYWVTDNEGMEMAAGGLQLIARDYAKLGQLYLQKGNWRGNQLVPESWVADSVTPDAPHLMAEAHPDYPLSYGYQWWIPPGDEGEYCALGVYNQAIYVNPARDLVIVKLSANSNYGLTNTEESYREFEGFELFRAIGRALEG